MNNTMLHFRPATETDPEAVRSLLRDTCYQGCDLNIMNLAGWSFHFGTELSLDAGRLVGRFRLAGRTAYMAAVTDGSWRETLDLIAADADRLGAPLLLTGVCRHVVPHIEAAHPGRFRFTPVRNLFDYVYRREDLATLAGKKLQPKRNHANRFARLYPDYVFAPMTTADAPDCLALAERWAARHSAGGDGASAGGERDAIRYVLSHWDRLGALGGTLRVDGRLVAFTYGGAVNGTTFDVCVEKADTDYDGAYAVINRDFARSLPEQFAFVNREEDLGIEGLRRAKLSYHPHVLLEKCAVTLLSSPEPCLI